MLVLNMDVDQSDLIRIERRLNRTMRKYPSRIAERVRDEVSDESPVDSGKLAKSWKAHDTGMFESTVTSNLPYAEIVYTGRKAITAQPGKALRFEVNGQFIYAKHVDAVEPNDYIDRGIQKVDLNHEMRRLLEEEGW